MEEPKPLYLLAAEALKHLKNRNYGLLENVLHELWERQADQKDDIEQKQDFC